jgi:hypothetical protein
MDRLSKDKILQLVQHRVQDQHDMANAARKIMADPSRYVYAAISLENLKEELAAL